MPTKVISLTKHIPLTWRCFPPEKSCVRKRNESFIGTCAWLKLVCHIVSGHFATLTDGQNCKRAKEIEYLLIFFLSWKNIVFLHKLKKRCSDGPSSGVYQV